MVVYRRVVIWIMVWMLFLSSPLSLFAQTLEGGVCDGEIQLTENTTLTNTIKIGSSNKLTIDLNGYVLTKAGGGRLFEISNGKTLIVKDSRSSTSNTGNWGLDGEEVTIAGGVMTGGVANHGGAVLIENGGKMEFLGGTIAGCRADNGSANSIDKLPNGCGGAVCVEAGGYFKISGGNIAYCQTKIYEIDPSEPYLGLLGGAVYVKGEDADNQVDFLFDKGQIYKCRSNNGGGVFVNRADFQMIGTASIAECVSLFQATNSSSSFGGGGIFIQNARMRLGENAIIKQNKSNHYGMGIFVNGASSTALIENGIISDNVPYLWEPENATHGQRQHGGGIFVLNGKLEMKNGVIKNNVATSGGGVMIQGGSSEFDLWGGTITENRAIGTGGWGNGGAVYVNSATFNFHKGVLSKNYARRYGGAVNINSDAKFNLLGECIIDSNVAGHGGGLSQERGDCQISLNQSEVQIINNKAIGIDNTTGNGGGIFIEMGTLNISAGMVKNNVATGKGGGISLYVKRIIGDITVNMTGGHIEGNEAVEGGGIDVFGDINNPNKKNEVKVYLNFGTFQENTAAIGGGVHVGVNQKNSVANMYVGTASTSPNIIQNIATQNGGGLAMDNGSIEVVNGLLTGNKATNNGGGIYIQNGNFDIIGKAVISKNTAKNGGGFCVEEGSVTIKEGDVSENTAHELGGGLYVTTTSTGEQKTVTFDGGRFRNNQASVAGGGVAVVGNLSVAMNGNIEENTATNGGGIYLKGAEMNFGKGLIRFNQANASSSLKGTTGYQQALTALNGMGGGIYLDNSSKLTFTSVNEMGLYDNLADNGGDDIFANGSGTSITLPEVSEMELTGFGDAGELYWVEDYITDDIGYKSGTTANSSWNGANSRYRDALKNNLETYPVNPQQLNGYACLALGHEIIYVTILKEGLQTGESSIFEISNPGETKKRSILLTGISNDGQAVSKRVALTSGEWTVTETGWSWSYDLSTPASGRSITQTITSGSEFKFVNKKTTTLPLHDEAKVENTMQGVKTE